MRGSSPTRPVATSRTVSLPPASASCGQVADHRPFVALDGPRIGLILAQDDGCEKGRFARAIGADQRHALAIVHLHRGVLEQGAATDGFPEVSNR